MDKKNILKEFENDFKDMQKEYGFSVSLEELEEEFSLKDYILEAGYVREKLIVQVNSLIVDYFRNWASYLNSLMVPNSQSYPNQTESKLFQLEEDRKKMWEMVKECMKFSSMYSFSFLSKDKILQSKFIDEAYLSWVTKLRPYMSEVMKKVYSAWSEN